MCSGSTRTKWPWFANDEQRKRKEKKRKKNQKSTINRISETVPKQEKSRNFWLCVESQLDVVELILPMFFFWVNVKGWLRSQSGGNRTICGKLSCMQLAMSVFRPFLQHELFLWHKWELVDSVPRSPSEAPCRPSDLRRVISSWENDRSSWLCLQQSNQIARLT